MPAAAVYKRNLAWTSWYVEPLTFTTRLGLSRHGSGAI
jgi:hypothetical protein